MTTLVGLFFSFISVFGLLKCKSKRAIKKILLVAFSIFLILAQILFMNGVLEVSGQEFVALSGLLSGIILILVFQRNDPEE
jgi:purine-cytosine permease-like protein